MAIRVKIDGELPLVSVSLSIETLEETIKLFQSLPIPPPALGNRKSTEKVCVSHTHWSHLCVVIFIKPQFSDISITDQINTHSVLQATQALEAPKTEELHSESDC